MQSKTTAKDFFLYLGVMMGLYVSTISFLVLMFQIINALFPFAGVYFSGENMIRSSIATLVIFFPAFLYLGYLAYKDMKINPEKKDMWVRRWMIFFTLFVAGLTIAIDLVTLIYRFLGAQDLTLEFLLKIFFVFGSAGMAFRLCFYELKRDPTEYKKMMRARIWLMSLVRIAAIVCGIIIIGLPAQQRAKMFDDQRINDLSSIQNQIVYRQWENKGTVPTSTEILNDPISGFIVPTDPETGAAYGYVMLTKNSFELCATFETVEGTGTVDSNAPTPALYPDPIINQDWEHGIGNVCFTRTIDPTLYKVTPTSQPQTP